jgi:hypothetical protein
MRKHTSEVLAAGDKAVDAYIINWLAWAVQHPDQQPETALVFLGKRGTGRGTLGNAMWRIFGNHALHITSPQHLVGRFNAHLRQCAFLFADEAYAVADRIAEGRLKALITDPTIPMEAKGRDVITVPNHLHVMMASNEDWVVPAGEIERRFVVQEVANDHAQDPGLVSSRTVAGFSTLNSINKGISRLRTNARAAFRAASMTCSPGSVSARPRRTNLCRGQRAGTATG